MKMLKNKKRSFDNGRIIEKWKKLAQQIWYLLKTYRQLKKF